MKHSNLLLFLLIFLPTLAFGQLYGTGVGYVNGTPSHTPNIVQKGSELCVSINNKMLYLWNRDSSEWKPLGGITVSFGVPTTAPAAVGGTRTAINIQTGLIYWWNGTAWKELISYSVEIASAYAASVSALYAGQIRAELADSTATVRAIADTKLAKADTSAMLSKYIERGDTSAMLTKYIERGDTSAMLSKYIERGDTSAMLSKYIERGDTSAMLSKYIERGDTSAMLSRYIERGDTAIMLSTYLSTPGFGLRKTTKTIRADSAVLATLYYVGQQINGLTSTYFPLLGGTLTGGSGVGYIGFPAQSSTPATPSSGFRLYATSAGRFAWVGTNGFIRELDGSSNTASRVYTLPDASGTFGLLGSSQTWSGLNTFNNFQVVSTTQYSIPAPKMTTVQRDALTGLTSGARIYNTTNNKPSFYNGTTWLENIGAPSGGIINTQIPFGNSTGDLSSSSSLTWTTTGNPTLKVGSLNIVDDGNGRYIEAVNGLILRGTTNTSNTVQILSGTQLINITGINGVNIRNASSANTVIFTSVNAPPSSSIMEFAPQRNDGTKYGVVRTQDATFGGAGALPINLLLYAGKNTSDNVQANTILAHDGTNTRGNVLIGTITDIPSSIFSVSSTSKGTRPITSMTDAQISGIASPALGLQAFSTTSERINLKRTAGFYQVAYTQDILRDTSFTNTNNDISIGASLTTTQIKNRHNAIRVFTAVTAGATADSNVTLPTPDANLLGVYFYFYPVDASATYKNTVQFGTNNLSNGDGTYSSSFNLSANFNIQVSVGWDATAGAYKYFIR